MLSIVIISDRGGKKSCTVCGNAGEISRVLSSDDLERRIIGVGQCKQYLGRVMDILEGQQNEGDSRASS